MITEDNLLLISVFVIFWLLVLLITLKNKKRIRIILFNLIIQLCYSSYFLYQLQFNSQYGNSIVWWFYSMIFVGIHFVIFVLWFLGYRFLKSRYK